MAISKAFKKQLKKEQKVKSPLIAVESGDDSFTTKDRAIMDLAKLVIWGVLILIAAFGLGLFILSLINSQNTSLFKDIVSTLIAVASGILGSILGYYYKNNEK